MSLDDVQSRSRRTANVPQLHCDDVIKIYYYFTGIVYGLLRCMILSLHVLHTQNIMLFHVSLSITISPRAIHDESIVFRITRTTNNKSLPYCVTRAHTQRPEKKNNNLIYLGVVYLSLCIHVHCTNGINIIVDTMYDVHI
jgi:hypothetical protein